MQRSRMLSSAVQVVSELGYQRMSVARIAGRARVSRRTFYDVFSDREDCFLAAFDEAVTRAQTLVEDAYGQEHGAWRERVRAGLSALLVFLDEQPEMRSLLIVDALQAGPRVLRARAEILEQLGTAVHEDGSRAKSAREFPPLTGEGVVGAVFSVLHTRLLADRSASLVELLNPLMAMVVLPYLGPVAARRETKHRLPKAPPGRRGASRSRTQGAWRTTYASDRGRREAPPIAALDPLAGLPMRLTYRTMRALSAIGEQPGASNRQIGESAGASDQGQISKLLMRLQKLGLIENLTGHQRSQPTGEPNAWRLTPLGEEVWQTVMPPVSGANDRQSN
jgi:AcrR family transcriptional regulator/DNA-binding MarR family transcriptional regulator